MQQSRSAEGHTWVF